MKKILLVVLLLPQLLQAQLHFSTSLRQDYTWSNLRNEWVLYKENGDEVTFFDFNKELTIMKHTTPTLTSSYMIRFFNEDKKNNRWEFDVTSDVGNKYRMIIDLDNNNIRFINHDYTFLVRHTIKRSWVDE